MVKKGLSLNVTLIATWHDAVYIVRPNWLFWEDKVAGAGAERTSGSRRDRGVLTEGGSSVSERSQRITDILEAELTGHGDVGMKES